MNKKAKKPAAPGLPGLIFALVMLFALPSNKLRLVWRMLGRGSGGLRMLMRDPQSLLIALAFAVLALIALVSFIRLITGAAPKKAVSSAGKAVKARPVSFAERDFEHDVSPRRAVFNRDASPAEEAIHCGHRTGRQKYMDQIDSFLKNGLIDRSEYNVLKAHYENVDIPDDYHG